MMHFSKNPFSQFVVPHKREAYSISRVYNANLLPSPKASDLVKPISPKSKEREIQEEN